MGFRDDPDSIREECKGLDLLGEEYNSDPGKPEIGTTIDVKVPTPGASGDSSEALVENLRQRLLHVSAT